MPALKDGAVTLVVTSPPYYGAISYASHVADPDAHYRDPANVGSYEQYLDDVCAVFAECSRVLASGAILAIVIGTALVKGKHYPIPFHLVPRLELLEFEFHESITWNKVTGGVKRAGTAIQHRKPHYYYPNIMTESILLMRRKFRPGEEVVPLRDRINPITAWNSRYAVDSVFTRDVANNVWHIAPVPPHTIDHPCPFPEEIPYRLIQLYSWQGSLVLDPFNGAGQTTKVAHHLGRRGVGYDTEQKYVDLAGRRWKDPLGVREYQLIPRMDRVRMGPDPPVTQIAPGVYDGLRDDRLG